MIEINIKVDTEKNNEIDIDEMFDFSDPYTLTELATMVFELEKIKQRLILKSYDAKPLISGSESHDVKPNHQNKKTGHP